MENTKGKQKKSPSPPPGSRSSSESPVRYTDFIYRNIPKLYEDNPEASTSQTVRKTSPIKYTSQIVDTSDFILLNSPEYQAKIQEIVEKKLKKYNDLPFKELLQVWQQINEQLFIKSRSLSIFISHHINKLKHIEFLASFKRIVESIELRRKNWEYMAVNKLHALILIELLLLDLEQINTTEKYVIAAINKHALQKEEDIQYTSMQPSTYLTVTSLTKECCEICTVESLHSKNTKRCPLGHKICINCFHRITNTNQKALCPYCRSPYS